MTTRPILSTVLLLAALVLGGCGGSDGGSDGGDAVLWTAATALGTVVVDADGRTVYYFDGDTPDSGESACAGDCMADWPPLTAETENPQVDGVTGDVGTISRDDGAVQVTLDGRPLYLYVEDEDAGDVTGQGVGDVWWVVAPDGAAISTMLPAPEAPSY